jgi:hypothetical protein
MLYVRPPLLFAKARRLTRLDAQIVFAYPSHSSTPLTARGSRRSELAVVRIHALLAQPVPSSMAGAVPIGTSRPRPCPPPAAAAAASSQPAPRPAPRSRARQRFCSDVFSRRSASISPSHLPPGNARMRSALREWLSPISPSYAQRASSWHVRSASAGGQLTLSLRRAARASWTRGRG